jgi:hypothetical protein
MPPGGAHLEAVAHVEGEQRDVRSAGDKLARLHRIECGVEISSARLGRQEESAGMRKWDE